MTSQTSSVHLDALPLGFIEHSSMRRAIDMEFNLTLDTLIEEKGITLTRQKAEAAYARIVPDLFASLLREKGAVRVTDVDVEMTTLGNHLLTQRMSRKLALACCMRAGKAPADHCVLSSDLLQMLLA